MGKTYGQMTSFDNAIRWAQSMPDSADKQHSINRMRYERDKSIPVRPKAYKGRYWTTWNCGNCGSGLTEAHWKYCPACGFAIGKKT